MNYGEFLVKIQEIKEISYISSHQEGDAGVGRTLEDLLGIQENNIAGPDFEIYELKSGRKSTGSMLTLFTKAPQPEGANAALVSAYGYRKGSRRRGVLAQPPRATQTRLDPGEPPLTDREKELHTTVEFGRSNSFGFTLGYARERLVIENRLEVRAYYDPAYLEKAFNQKYGHKMVYVLAERRKPRAHPEQFWYNEGYLLSGFDFRKFVEMVKEKIVKLDLRLGHNPDGSPHDHGTGFRVFPKDLPKCFGMMDRIL